MANPWFPGNSNSVLSPLLRTADDNPPDPFPPDPPDPDPDNPLSLSRFPPLNSSASRSPKTSRSLLQTPPRSSVSKVSSSTQTAAASAKANPNSSAVPSFSISTGLAVSMHKTSFFASGLTAMETDAIQASTVWVAWFKEEVLNGNLSNLWTTAPNRRFSWQVNKLLKLSPLIYEWIHLRVSNGLSCRFWSDNWSPFGSLTEYLQLGPQSSLGIPLTATLASLCSNNSWRLPSARSENQGCLYWTWTERNARLHRNTSRPFDVITRLLDRQIKDRILSFRTFNPTVSSIMMQQWLS
ncbi:hypothetical protein F2Q69_00046443 [Brassica cretica]|uniref:Reverse transcriptase zinc-binding domain-containing protein n=1 Tax=Brassica cretica TaxID=69181 RepID=A0A8S9PXD1_BRACR|nr:hypothetical protein F2Q69_00046443 [Brassica cretica]